MASCFKLFLIIIFILTFFNSLISGDYPILGKVHRLTTAIDKLIPADAQLEKLVEGLEWSEGPVWASEGKFLLFSDIPKNTIYRWSEREGISIFLRPAGYSGTDPAGEELGTNGLTFDPQGNLVVCDHGNRCISRINLEIFTREILADKYQDKRLNSPNDLIIKSNGDIYFTDPPYGLEGLDDSPKKELDFNGIYLLRKSGELILLSKEMTRPNGIGFSPDERILYVAQSDTKNPLWRAFNVKSDGTIEHSRIFFDARLFKKEGLMGSPDGMVIDSAGNVWATGPGGVHIFTPEGEHLGWIETGQATSNCTFGDDGSTLYITADMLLCRIKTTAKGIGFK
jgi:gluconolactonase